MFRYQNPKTDNEVNAARDPESDYCATLNKLLDACQKPKFVTPIKKQNLLEELEYWKQAGFHIGEEDSILVQVISL